MANAGVLHRIGLRNRPRKAVEQIAARAVGLLEPLLDQPDDDLVGHQRSRIHHLLGRDAERRARLDRGAQHVARGYLRDAVRLADERGLRSLSRTRRAEQDQSHVDLRNLNRWARARVRERSRPQFRRWRRIVSKCDGGDCCPE